jgi:methionine-rich copper-binding protein CopC
MNQVKSTGFPLIWALLAVSFTACASNPQSLPLLRAEPAADGVITSAPRILRLYFSALPDVSQSKVRLTGPSGNYQLRDLHNMADDDLMMEIVDDVSSGIYTVNWTTVIEGGQTVYQGY